MTIRRPRIAVRDRSTYVVLGPAVDHLVLSPSAVTLTIDVGGTQTPVDHVVLSTTSVTLDAPAPVVTGALVHMGWGRTWFSSGSLPQSDYNFAEAGPLNRMRYAMSPPTATLKALFPDCICTPYALHHFTEATGQEPSDNATVSWGTVASDWATANGRTLENIYLHAASGQQNNKAVVTSLSATGLVTLGKQSSNLKQQLSQARLGVAASNAFQIGSSYTVSFTSPAFSQTVTVTGIPSQTTIQTNYTGTAQSGTGGAIFTLGDGTITLANRIFFESESDWAWATNPGSQDGKDFQVFRMGQILGSQNDGVFFDSHSASNMHFQSVEYGTSSSTQYVNDIAALFTLYRQTYPGTIYFPNLANFTTSQDDQFAIAAGGCQMEGALNIFQSNRPNDTIGTSAVTRLAAGAIVELGYTPAFNNAEPHAGVSGLSAAFRTAGQHNYTTPDDRSMMTNYAAALCLVDRGQPKKCFSDPANQFWNVSPIQARWEAAFDVPLGEPVDSLTPQKFVYASATGASQPSGVAVSVLGRVFSEDGTTNTPFTALVLMRVQSSSTVFDATTNFAVTINQAPPGGKTWALTDDQGTLTGSYTLGSTIGLWNVDSAIFIPR